MADDNKTVKNIDGIKAAQEQDRRDRDLTQAFLFDLRCGGMPEIMYDPVTGWELFMEDHRVVFPLDGSESAVNMILKSLVFHYQYLSATLGDPDKNRGRLQVIK